MVNSYREDLDAWIAAAGNITPLRTPLTDMVTGCTGPCHSLSANAAWSAPCANCPHLKEFAIHG